MNSAEVLTGMVVLAVAAMAAFACYRWQQRRRVRGVKKWVEDYLTRREGGPPSRLHINCSEDRLWPVLVSFDNPRNGTRHSLQFSCAGSSSTCSLLSEEKEMRQGAQAS